MRGMIYQSAFENSVEGLDERVHKTLAFLDSCTQDCDIIVLPESADMPFAPESKQAYIEAFEKYTGTLVKKAAETAKRCQSIVFVNAAFKGMGEDYYNTTYAFDRQGKLRGTYFKQHLTPGEVEKLKLASDYSFAYEEPYTLEIDGIRFAFLTCYDFYFYEAYSAIAQKRPHVIIGCAQQRSDTHEAAKIYARFVSYVTGAYLLRAGVSFPGDSPTAGSSMAVAPDGEILAYRENGEGGISFDFDPFKKYLKPMGYLNPVGLHHDYTEKGRRPWKYRAAGSAIVRDNRSMPYPRICAHRGFSTVAPENSMPAFGSAIALGAEEIEFDLWWTKDGEIVSMHDDTLDRISNGSGKVYEKTFAELKQLDFGGKFSKGYEGLGIVKFEDILAKFSGHVVMNVHIKDHDEDHPLDEGFLKKIIALIDKYDNRKYVYFMSANDCVLKQLGELAPDIARCVGENRQHFRIVDRAIEMGIDRVQLFKPYFNDEMIQKAKEHGIILNLFWSDDPEEAQMYLDKGIDCVLTNDFLKIKNALKSNE